MSGSGTTVAAELVDHFSSNFDSLCCIAAITVMVMYDCLLTFAREVQLFWREPSNGLGGTIIFALNRLTAIGLVVVGHLNVDLTSYTLSSCKSPAIVQVVFTVMAYAIWATTSAIRVHALSGHKWLLSLFTFLLAIIPAAADLWEVSIFTVTLYEVDGVQLCWGTHPGVSVRTSESLLVACRVCSIVSELIVLSVTVYKVWPTSFTALPKGSLARVLFRNGTLYFIALSIINALELILYYRTNQTTYVNFFLAPVLTIIVSRFMLDIRGAANDASAAFISKSCESEGGMWRTLEFAGPLAHENSEDSLGPWDSDYEMDSRGQG